MFELIDDITTRIKRERPLILNITNHVSMDFVANGLLCLGASPIMSLAEQEMEELTQLAAVTVINPGTLSDSFIRLSTSACQAAQRLHKSIVLDPVGAGASQYRTTHNHHLLTHYPIALLRGNASEIMALAGASARSKGVESQHTTQEAIAAGTHLAEEYGLTVQISGKQDAVIQAQQSVALFNHGSPLMPQITGTGCLFSAVIAAFFAVHQNAFEAAQAATLFYSVCGEIAERQASAPGSFKVCFLDALYASPKRGDYAS